MAKDRKPLPGVESVDASDKAALGGTYVPNPNKKAVKRARRVIPGSMEVTTSEDGNLNIQETAPKIAGTLAHINNPLLHRKAGMSCQGMGRGTGGGCDYPVTDIVRNAARPRGSAIGLCKNCLGKATHEAIKAGHELEVTKATARNIQDLKKVQSQEKERADLRVAGALLLKGNPEEEALSFNMKKTPGRPSHERAKQGVTLGGAPRMSEEESLEYYKNAQKKTPPVYEFKQKPSEVKVGNKGPKEKEEDLPLGEGSGIIDEVIRRYRAGDDSFYDLAKEHNITNLLYPRDVPTRPANRENLDKIIYTKTPERLQKAISNVSEDQAEQVTMASAQNALAAKQRAIQAKRAALPGSRPGLPSRRNTPFQLGSGENKGLPAPKKGLEPPTK
jgi:hypothetical protein